ncbi:MAG: O-antigen ligase family protein [Brevundimonas sp.]|jgi:hypothetical protein|uniref:O-antigen ligase family protein n=1 Tax=Brevundimonas sp. TaxID=1871086 RepID=UPI004034D1CB
MAERYLNVSPAAAQNLRRLTLFLAMLMSGGNLIFPRLPLLLMVLGLCVICKGATLGIRREMAPIGLVLLGVFAVAILGSDGVDLVALATRYANFVVGAALLGLYLTEPRDTLSRDLLPIFRLMSVQIFLTIILAFVTPNLFVPSPVNDTVYYTIYWVFTYHHTIVNESGLIRPNGFFFEPGAFQVYMNIFLFMSLFVLRKRNDVILAVVSIFALQSTTGILISVFLIGAYYAINFKTSGMTGRFVIAVVAPIVAVPLIIIGSMNLESKFTGDHRGSAWARQYDFFTGLNVIRANPFLGIGFDYERYKVEARRVGYDAGELDFSSTADRQNSNGLLTLLISIGIPMSLPFLFALFRQRFFKPSLVFGVLLSLSFMGEAIMLTPFFLMIIFSAMLLTPETTARAQAWFGLRRGQGAWGPPPRGQAASTHRPTSA